MFYQPLLFTRCSSIQLFNSPSFPNTVRQDTYGTLSLTLRYFCYFGMQSYSIDHQVLPIQLLPREAENFPRRSNYPKDMALPTFLAYFQSV